MSSLPSRLRWSAAVVVAFVGGLLLASGLDLTRLGFAQGPPSAAAQPLTGSGSSFVAIANRVTPAVVSISARSKVQPQMQPQLPNGLPPGFEQFFGIPRRQGPIVEGATGSGFIVSKDGYILTNNHVVTGPDRQTLASDIRVTLLDGRTFPAKVIGHDPTTDIAVIKIDGSNFPTIPLGNDNTAQVGEWVLAIGNPLDLGFTVTAGIVSAKNRPLQIDPNNRYGINDFIQTDAAINPGNSGGPLVNTRGEAIGVNSAIASETGYYAGYGFAIPITLAKKVMDDLIAHGRVRYGILGVSITDATANDAAVAGLTAVRGAVVQGFNPDTPTNAARQAGLQPGDVIVGLDGQRVDRVSALQRLVRNYAPGQTVRLDVMRYGKSLTLSVRLMDMPGASSQAAAAGSVGSSSGTGKLGVQITALPPATQRPAGAPSHGVIVTAVDPLGPAAGSAPGSGDVLVRGDVITAVRYPVQRTINTPADLQSVLAGLKPGSYVSLEVASQTNSGFQTRIVNLQLGNGQ